MKEKLPEDIEALKEKIRIDEETLETDMRNLKFREEVLLLSTNK